MPFNMVRQTHRMFAHQPRSQIGIAYFQCGNDRSVIPDGSLGPVILRHRDGADGAHMNEQCIRQARHQLDPAQPDDGPVECHVGVGILADMIRRIVLEHFDQAPKFRQCASGSPRRGQPGGHAFDRGPDGNHLHDLALGFAHHKDAAAGNGADEPFLLQHGQCLPDRGAADAQVL